jgi:ABC-type sugar transport system permease subunit
LEQIVRFNENKRNYSENKLAFAPWYFLLPAIIFFLIYVIFPIFQSVWISFYEWDGLGEAQWVGLANYVELFDDEYFYTSLKNNFIWLIMYLLAVPMGLFIALFLNQVVFGIRFYKSLFFFPFVISQVVVGLIFSWFYNPNFGLLASIFLSFGLEPIATVIGALRSFDMVAIMTEGGPYGSSNVLAYYMYETALSEYGFRLGYGSAIATVLFFIMLVYIGYFLWRLYKNEREV